MKEEQGKKPSEVANDAAVKEVIPTKPTALSDEDLDKVAGGTIVPIVIVSQGDEVGRKHNYKGVVTLVR